MTGLQDRLGSIRMRLWPGAGRFLAWWGRSLAAWLPSKLRRALGLGRGRLMLRVAPDGIVLARAGDEGLHELGRLPAGAFAGAGDGAIDATDPLAPLLSARQAELPRWLLVPAASGLRRRLALPAAAADRLRDVVGFEVDRQTPFGVDDVLYDALLLGRREQDGQLEVELVVVPRRALDAQLQAIGALAGDLAGIDVAGDDGRPIGVNLLPPAERRAQRDAWRLWNRGLALLALVACGLMLGQVLLNRRAAADAFEQEIAAQATKGRQAAAQRQRLVALVQGQAFLDAARDERPTSIEVIDELTRRLPDDTYLEKLSLEDKRMMLIGLSAEAPALVGRLQGSPYWTSPALAGALQPDPSSGRDRFTLTAELVGGRPAAAGGRPGPTAPDAAGDDMPEVQRGTL